MAIIQQPKSPSTRSTQATLFSGATSALFLTGFGSAGIYFVHALRAAGALSTISEHAWLTLSGGLLSLLMSIRSAARAWNGEWPDTAGADYDDDPIVDANADVIEPSDAELDYLDCVAAFYDPGDDGESTPPAALGESADDKKMDVDSSS